MDKELTGNLFNVPNLLSLFRIALIPFFIGFLQRQELNLAIVTIIISSLTDTLDGFIARKFNKITEIGKILDPAADKLTQVSILYALVLTNQIPLFIFVIVLLKELSLGIGLLYLKGIAKKDAFSSNIAGKCATALFYISIILMLLKVEFAVYLLYASIALAIGAWGLYISKLKKVVAAKSDDK